MLSRPCSAFSYLKIGKCHVLIWMSLLDSAGPSPGSRVENTLVQSESPTLEIMSASPVPQQWLPPSEGPEMWFLDGLTPLLPLTPTHVLVPRDGDKGLGQLLKTPLPHCPAGLSWRQEKDRGQTLVRGRA